MRLPNLNWPANLYGDVTTPAAEIELTAGFEQDNDPLHDPCGAHHNAMRAGMGARSGAGGDEFRSFTIGGASPHPGVTASRP